MADIKQDIKPTEEQQNFAVGTTNDPKNLQELSQYVPHSYKPIAYPKLVQYFQREQNVTALYNVYQLAYQAAQVKYSVKQHKQIQSLLQQTQDKFQTMSEQIITRIDEMGTRIDDLEKNISDLMTQAGVDGADK